MTKRYPNEKECRQLSVRNAMLVFGLQALLQIQRHPPWLVAWPLMYKNVPHILPPCYHTHTHIDWEWYITCIVLGSLHTINQSMVPPIHGQCNPNLAKWQVSGCFQHNVDLTSLQATRVWWLEWRVHHSGVYIKKGYCMCAAAWAHMTSKALTSTLPAPWPFIARAILWESK